MKKRVLSALLSIIMLLTLIVPYAGAAGGGLSIDKSQASVGDTITAAFTIPNSVDAVNAVMVSFSYDNTALEATSISWADIPNMSKGAMSTPANAAVNGKFGGTWEFIDDGGTTLTAGTIMTALFTVLDGAKATNTISVTAFEVAGGDFGMEDFTSDAGVSSYSASFSLTVPATGITVQDAAVLVGQTAALSYSVEPSNATEAVSFASDDPEVATVSDDGVVTGVKDGTATITVTAGNASGTCVVTVTHTHTAGTEIKHNETDHWYECSICGAEMDKTAHTLTNVVTKPASCTETGVQHKECTICGYVGADETIGKLAHTMEYHAAVAADHNSRTNGSIEYWHCTSCDTDYADAAGTTAVTNTVIAWDSIDHSYPENWSDESTAGGENYNDAAEYHYKTCGCGTIIKEAHSFEFVTDTPASCTAAGSGHEECSVCGYKKAAQPIDQLAHTMTHHDAVAATCSAEGNVEYWSCSTCNKNYDSATGGNELASVTVAVDPTNHSGKQHHEASPAGCTQPGTKEYWECTACGKKYSDSGYTTEIADFDAYITAAALGHSFGDTLLYDATGHWKECTKADCDAADKGKAETFTAHTLTNVVTKPASCTETGVQHKECTGCGYVGADETIEKLAHNMEHHAAVAADHNSRTDGSIEYWHCTSCNTDYADAGGTTAVTNTVIAWDSIDHSYPENWSDESTSGNESYNDAAEYHYKTCGCGTIIKEAHSFEFVTDTPASCTAAGSGHEECSVCGYKKAAQPIDQLAHTMTHHDAVAATCVAEGNVEYWRCSTCNKNYDSATGGNELASVTLAVDASNHSGKQHHEASPAGCTQPGTKEYWECTACGKKFSDSGYTTEIADFDAYITAAALGHSFGDTWLYDATGHWHECTKADCDAADKGKAETFTAHTLTNVVTKNATCTETGTQHKECTVCDYVGADETIEKLAHTMEHHAAVAADHNNRTNGSIEYWHCTSCNTDYADAAGTTAVTNTVIAWDSIDHSYPENWSDESTTGGENYNDAAEYHYKTCGCGTIIKEAHSFEFVTDTPASCTAAGSGHEECSVCGYKKAVQPIDQLAHTMTHHDAVAATCSAEGNVEYWSCSTCNKNYDSEAGGNVIDDVTLAIDPDNHVEASVTAHEAVAPGCVTDGVKAYWECTDCGNAYSDSAMTADSLIGKTTDDDFADKIKDAALTHDYSEDKYACDDNNHWLVCARENCDDLAGSKKYDSVEAHTFGDWTVKTPSTTTTKGVQIHSCTVCGFEEEAELPEESSGDNASQATADATVAAIIEAIENGETPSGVDEATVNAIKDYLAQNDGHCGFSSRIVSTPISADNVPAGAKSLVEACASAQGCKVGQYYSVTVYIVGTDNEGKVTTLGQVTELNAAVTLSFTAPGSLAAQGRTFYVIRVHEGAVAVISSGTQSMTVTAQSDKFSTYAIAYKDPQKTSGSSSTSVRTGDSNNILLYVMLMAFSATAIGAGSVYKKKKQES